MCACGGDHVVQFYEDDAFLVERLSEFVAAGAAAGEGVVVIATAPHREATLASLDSRGVDAGLLVKSGRLVMLDARETLRQLCFNGEPNEERFGRVIGVLLDRLMAGGRVRAFGEMVALLWEDGKPDAAIKLEEIWSRCCERGGLEVFCAYPMRAFRAARAAPQFERVCRVHSRVRPAESFWPQAGLTEAQLRQVAALQQRAGALEGEVAERAVVDENARHLAAIVEGSDDAIISKNLHGIVTSWNPAAQRIFGYTAEEVIGRSVTLLIPADRLGEEEMILSRLRRGERINHYDTLRRRKDGTLVAVSLTISPVRNSEGSIVGASKIARDITERKAARDAVEAAQQELARTNRELEQRVAERTASLTDLLSQMETFSYTISHDLRAPLRSMAGFAQVLKDDYGAVLDAEGRQYVERIVRASERMSTLINDVLAYARVSRDRLELAPVSPLESLKQVIQHATELQEPAVRIRLPETIPMVTGNEAFLTQVFSNLLGNAVKFVAPGRTPEIDVVARSEDGWVRIEVADNGIGIAMEDQERLFGLFERLQAGKKYDGTGIGLAIARRAVERMGGKIGVDSRGGRGSRFWFSLPRAEALAAEAAKASSAESSGKAADRTPSRPGGRRTILAVDDNQDDNFMFRRLLRQTGVEASVETLDGGEQATAGILELLAAGTPPLVCFLDIKMPGLNGFEVLRWIREQPGMNEVPVVMLSSSDEPRDIAAAVQGGAQCFLKKHPNAEELRRVLQEVASHAERGGAPTIVRSPVNLLPAEVGRALGVG